jgi:hypothetical protein
MTTRDENAADVLRLQGELMETRGERDAAVARAKRKDDQLSILDEVAQRIIRQRDTLRARLAEVEGIRTFKDRAADALADEVTLLVDRQVIDVRSPAADALLDYRDNGGSSAHVNMRSARSNRIKALEDRLAEVEGALRQAESLIQTVIRNAGQPIRLPLYLSAGEVHTAVRAVLSPIPEIPGGEGELCSDPDCNVKPAVPHIHGGPYAAREAKS